MNELKKLHTFNLHDKYGWPYEAVLREAHATAVRRSDIMNWQNISVRDSGLPPVKNQDTTTYSFEIWGIENESASRSDASSENSKSTDLFGRAAKEVSP